MPYAIRKAGSKFEVVTEGTDKVHGSFETEEEAKKQLAALYENAPPGGERKDEAGPVRRFDACRLDGPTLLPNGWLRADARIAKTGIQEYRLADGTVRREFRPPEEVFDAASLQSFSLVPVTDDHPEEGLLTADNARKYQRGHLGESVTRDGDKVRATILITDGDLVRKVLDGKTQLSCGYEVDLDPTPGEWQGQRFDCRQRNVRGNHVAVVDRGRAGPEVRLRLDTGDAVSIRGARQEDTPPPTPGRHSEERHMVKIKVDGIEVEVGNEQGAQLIERHIAALSERADAAEKVAKQAKQDKEDSEQERKTELDAYRARADVAEAKAKELEKARNDAAQALPALVQARVALESKARELLGADAKFDGKSDREVKALVIGKLVPDVKLDGEADVYVDTVYRGALATASSEALATLRAAAVTNGGQHQDAMPDPVAAREKARRDHEEEWKKPLSSQR